MKPGGAGWAQRGLLQHASCGLIFGSPTCLACLFSWQSGKGEKRAGCIDMCGIGMGLILLSGMEWRAWVRLGLSLFGFTEEWKGGQHGFLAHRLADITPFILFRERRIFSPSS